MARLRAPKTQDANIWQDKNGVWRFDVQLKRPNGTVFRKNGTAKDKKDARRKRDDAFHDFNSEGGKARSSYTVAQWAEFCLTELWPHELRDRSLGAYEDNLRVHILPILGDTLLKDLSPEQVQLFMNRLSDSQLSRSSVLKVKTVLSSLLTRAQERSLVEGNVARLSRVKVQTREIDEDLRADKRILTPNEREKLLGVTGGTYIHGAVLLALKMGLRAGECLGLTWDCIDFKGRTLEVRKQIQRVKGKGLILIPPKSTAGVRRISIPPSIYDFLIEERKLSRSKFVVSNGEGKPLEPSRLRSLFDDCAAVAGLWSCTDSHGRPLPDPTFHDLRSTFISYMANEHKIPPRSLM